MFYILSGDNFFRFELTTRIEGKDDIDPGKLSFFTIV
jgi:hypothetical protein